MSAKVARLVDYWTLNASGLTSVASNWSDGVPLRGDDVVVAPTAAGVVVTLDAAGFALGALTLQGATGVLLGGNLAVTKGATLQGATILGPHALILRGPSTISGLTLGGGAKLYNAGVVTQAGGALEIGTSKISRAAVYNLAGATWIDEYDGVVTQGAGAGGWFINHGTFSDVEGGGSLTTVDSSFLSDGTVSVAPRGILEFNGTHAQLSGAITGGGGIDYGASAQTTLGAATVTATNQTNFGVVNQTGTLTLQGAQEIDDRGTWNLVGDVSMLVSVADSASVTLVSYPNATFNKTAGTGVSFIGAGATLTGGVNVATGTLEFAGASNLFDGPITGAGTFELAAGASTLQSATLSVAQTVLSGGVTTIQGPSTVSGGFEGDAGATLTFGGAGSALTITGLATLSGLNINGSGSLFLDSNLPGFGPETMNVSGVTIGGSVQVVDEGEVLQGGDVTLGDSSATDAAGLTIGNGSAWADWVMGGHNILAGADPASTLTIGTGGNLVKSGAGVNVVAPAVVNNGLDVPSGDGFLIYGAQANGGTLDFTAAVSGTGSLNIFGASTLELDSSVGAGQNVAFFAVGGALYLTDLPDFHGSITGFGTPYSNDSLLFGGGIVALGGASETASSTTLSLLDSNHGAHSLTLTGDYVGHTFGAFYANGVLHVG